MVEIKSGWLIRQFVEHTFGFKMTEGYNDDTKIIFFQDQGRSRWTENLAVIHIGLSAFVVTEEMGKALERYDALVVQKNEQYGGSWETWGPIIPMADIVDKLARLDSATKTGAILTWDQDKKRGILFDLIIRSFMILAWEGNSFVDDDDDRQHSS